jgi:hypothetical protein
MIKKFLKNMNRIISTTNARQYSPLEYRSSSSEKNIRSILVKCIKKLINAQDIHQQIKILIFIKKNFIHGIMPSAPLVKANNTG